MLGSLDEHFLYDHRLPMLVFTCQILRVHPHLHYCHHRHTPFNLLKTYI